MIREPDFVDKCYKDSDLSALKRLTLVIPTYNRNFYLSRCLWYHAHFPFGQIIVADSSTDEKKVVNKEVVEKIREIFETDILYLEYPPETEKYGGDIYRKWGSAIMQVKSEYSEVCTDKEFVNPLVCCSSITFLDQNPSYVSAFGIRVDGVNKSTLSLEPFCDMCSTINDSALDRLSSCCKQRNFSENVFHVNRANIQKYAQNNHLTSGIGDIRYGEVIAELQYYLFGKIKIFETVGRIRDNSHFILRNMKLLSKDESSSSRYLFLENYPEEFQKELHNIAIDCLYCSLPENERTDEAKQLIVANCDEIMHWWMWVDPAKRKYSNRILILLNYFWNKLSIKRKIWLSVHMGSGTYARNFEKINRLLSSADQFIELSMYIINETMGNYDDDSVVDYLKQDKTSINGAIFQSTTGMNNLKHCGW